MCIQTALLTDYDHKFKTVCAVSTAFSFIATVKRWSSHRKHMVLMHLGVVTVFHAKVFIQSWLYFNYSGLCSSLDSFFGVTHQTMNGLCILLVVMHECMLLTQ